MDDGKALLGSIATLLALAAFIPYIRSIIAGNTRPHVFSWIIWGATTFIVFLAQLSAGGGAGTWCVGLSGTIAFGVAALAYIKRGDNSITRSDWICFVLALAAIPLWYVTADPLTAVLLLTFIDLAGYGPTLRKAYYKPYEEQALLYMIINIRNLLSIAALEEYSLATLFFQVATTIANMLVVLVVMYRRKKLSSWV